MDRPEKRRGHRDLPSTSSRCGRVRRGADAEAPFVFEVRDLWPQSLDAVGAAPPSSIFYRSLERLARFLYQRADRIVVDGEWKRSTLAAAGVQPEKIVVIRNGVRKIFVLSPGQRARYLLANNCGSN